MEMPKALEYWTADEVAECLDYRGFLPESYYKDDEYRLSRKLWSFLDEAENPTPIGGDGSNGTVEYPCGRQDLANDDKTRHWWHKLDFIEQRAIACGIKLYMNVADISAIVDQHSLRRS